MDDLGYLQRMIKQERDAVEAQSRNAWGKGERYPAGIPGLLGWR